LVQGVIGAGGMGSVYRADHARLPRSFAIKVLNETVDSSSELYQRFRREAEVCASLKHENIVEVVDFNITEDGRPYIVMEFLEGEDLAARLERVGPMPLGETLRILDMVCSGLAEAHHQGVVHRDMKPQNIFLCQRRGRSDQVKLVDFGISKIQGANAKLTGTHVLLGTPFYMSPEQTGATGSPLDHRTDLYSLGVIAFEMLSGRPPFDGENLAQIITSIITKRPDSLAAQRPDVPPMVDEVLGRAMAKDPSERFQTAGEFLEAFCRAAEVTSPGLMGIHSQGASSQDQQAPSVFTYSLPLPRVALEVPPAPETRPGATQAFPGGAQAQPGIAQAGQAGMGVAGGHPGAMSFVKGQQASLPGVERPATGVKTWMLILGGLSLVALATLVILFLVKDRGEGGPAAQGGPRASQEKAGQAMEAASPDAGKGDDAQGARPAPSRVVLRLAGLPHGARCRVDGRPQEGNPLVLERSQDPVEILCEANGRQAFRRSLIPDKDEEITVSMPEEPAHKDSTKPHRPPSTGMKRPQAMTRPMAGTVDMEYDDDVPTPSDVPDVP